MFFKNKKIEVSQSSLMSEVHVLFGVVVTLQMNSYRTTHRASVQNHCSLIRNILTLSNLGNLSQEKVTRIKQTKGLFHLSAALHCGTEFTFPNQVNPFSACYFSLSTNFSRMCLPEFCLLSFTWSYSCLFLLLEFHSWAVSLFLIK